MSLADMLSKAASPDEGDAADDGGADLESAVKAFFTAGKSGDYKTAASHLRDAMTLCDHDEPEGDEPPEDDEPSGGHHALLLMPRGK